MHPLPICRRLSIRLAPQLAVWSFAALVGCSNDGSNSSDTTTTDTTTADTTTATDATDTTSSAGTTDTTDTPTPPGQSSCVVGLVTGAACNPAVDTAPCTLATVSCACQASATWTCQPVNSTDSTDTTTLTGDTTSATGPDGTDTSNVTPTGDDSDASTMTGSETTDADATAATDETDVSTTDASAAPDTDTVDTTDTGGDPSDLEWLPSWATSIQATEPTNLPPALADKTLRQFVWPTYSGEEIRLQLSNEKGSAPVAINRVHIAMAGTGAGQIDAATDTPLSFGGSPNVTIPAGETVWSDAVDFPLEEMQLTALTMHFGTDIPPEITGHPGARSTSYVANGDVVSQASVSGETRDRWYFINAIEVMAPKDAYAISILGDSITDGYGVLNTFERWPDFLTIAINEDPQLADKVSVLNAGMGANGLLFGNEYMDAGRDRVARDILARPKVKWVIVLHGVNDILYGNQSASALTEGYQAVIQDLHAAGILVYGSPITPFATHSESSPARLNVRSEVNTWITSSNAFDAVVDLAAAVADPGNSQQLLSPLSNDGLHPNAAGYEAMAEAVDLSLFYAPMP